MSDLPYSLRFVTLALARPGQVAQVLGLVTSGVGCIGHAERARRIYGTSPKCYGTPKILSRPPIRGTGRTSMGRSYLYYPSNPWSTTSSIVWPQSLSSGSYRAHHISREEYR